MTKKAKNSASGKNKAAKGGRVLPAICNVLGTLMLLVVIVLCVPLTVPLLAGYQVFDVVSGSMEPEIPVGSVVYVKDVDLSEVQEGEVIAYHDGEDVIVHRVVTNRTSLGEFVTKGDANAVEDFEPIPYEAVVGRMESHVPILGAFMAIYASFAGKIYLLLTAACGVMLNMVASRMRESRRTKALERELADARAVSASREGANVGAGAGAGIGAGEGAGAGYAAGAGAGAGEGASSYGRDIAPSRNADLSQISGRNLQEASSRSHEASAPPKRAKRRTGSIVRGVLIAILAVAFLGSAGVVGYVNWQYGISDALYSDATDKYQSNLGDGSSANAEKPPIQIDFDELRKKNPDVIGWIYCPGTVINYPVLQGNTNDDYLHHDYTGDYNINGSIFVDSNNGYSNAKAAAGAEGAAGAVDATTANANAAANSGAVNASSDGAATPLRYSFEDANSIIYGHHMNSGSMFAGLMKWSEQSYFKEHPVMWLLTPTQDYKIILFSSHHVNAYSTMYQIIHAPGEELAVLLGEALAESELHANAQLDPTLSRLATMKGVDLSKVQVDESEPLVLLDPESRYVMLSTCAYLFDNDRYVLHGKLVPVKSAGGKVK